MYCDPELPITAEVLRVKDTIRWFIRDGGTNQLREVDGAWRDNAEPVGPEGIGPLREGSDMVTLIVVIRNACVLPPSDDWDTDNDDSEPSGTWSYAGRRTDTSDMGYSPMWCGSASLAPSLTEVGSHFHVLNACTPITGRAPEPQAFRFDLRDLDEEIVFSVEIPAPIANHVPTLSATYIDEVYRVGERVPPMVVADVPTWVNMDPLTVSFFGDHPPGLAGFVMAHEGPFPSDKTEPLYIDPYNQEWTSSTWTTEDRGDWDFLVRVEDNEGTGFDLPMAFRVTGGCAGSGGAAGPSALVLALGLARRRRG